MISDLELEYGLYGLVSNALPTRLQRLHFTCDDAIYQIAFASGSIRKYRSYRGYPDAILFKPYLRTHSLGYNAKN